VFTSIGGQARNYIAKLNNTTGAADLDWNPNSNGFIYTIAISGSDIYAGGHFTSIGGQTRINIAKMNNTTGVADINWNPNPNSDVSSIAISGSDIYAGGFFTSIGGQTRNHIAKLNNTTGGADATWNPNANEVVSSIAISGSDIYAGGWFTTIGGQARNYIAKLNNTNGAADVNWNPNANSAVKTIALSGSDIYAGGGFTTMKGNLQSYLALFTDRIIPVELTSFTANVVNNGVQLNWTTATELNNLGFEIERGSHTSTSHSVTNWEKIGFVSGQGTSTESHSYSFRDENLTSGKPTLPAGRYSYRLKQIDFNGSYEYSDIVEVVLTPIKFSLSQNYPNPFNPSTKISWQSPVGSYQTLKIYDVLGNEVATLVNEYREAGRYEVEFDARALASGIYFYRLQAGSFVETKKMLMLK
jgi:hypothetical protein